ncbi:hypothetical protein OTU49_014581, partial [Cherax quadricarinatus]
ESTSSNTSSGDSTYSSSAITSSSDNTSSSSDRCSESTSSSDRSSESISSSDKSSDSTYSNSATNSASASRSSAITSSSASSSATSPPTTCYTTNDLVVVVLLTTLANLVTFMVVTLALCWWTLRGRLSTTSRPLNHPDYHLNDDPNDEAEEVVAAEGCLEACLPDISYQRHIARGSNLRPSFVVGRALRPLVHPNPPRLSQAVHELLHNLTTPAEEAQPEGSEGERQEEQQKTIKRRKRKNCGLYLKRRSLSLEDLAQI